MCGERRGPADPRCQALPGFHERPLGPLSKRPCRHADLDHHRLAGAGVVVAPPRLPESRSWIKAGGGGCCTHATALRAVTLHSHQPRRSTHKLWIVAFF